MSEWISVENRLPAPDLNDEGCVICSDGNQVFEEFTSLVSLGVATGEITHWMPLPSPPEPKK